jgi:hypothetical protein
MCNIQVIHSHTLKKTGTNASLERCAQYITTEKKKNIDNADRTTAVVDRRRIHSNRTIRLTINMPVAVARLLLHLDANTTSFKKKKKKRQEERLFQHVTHKSDARHCTVRRQSSYPFFFIVHLFFVPLSMM